MDQRGIYILCGGYGPVYVGLTVKRGIGIRLKEHRKDRFRNRWDRFSWYGFRNVSMARNARGLSELLGMALTKSVVQRRMIHEIEALLINAMGLQNIRPGVFPVGEEWTQIRRDERVAFMGRLVPGRRRPQPRRARTK